MTVTYTSAIVNTTAQRAAQHAEALPAYRRTPSPLDLGAPRGRLIQDTMTVRVTLPDEARMLAAINRDHVRLDELRLRDVRRILDEHNLTSEVVECQLMQWMLAPRWTDVTHVRLPEDMTVQVSLAVVRLRYGIGWDAAQSWADKYIQAYDGNALEAACHLTFDAVNMQLSTPGWLWGVNKLEPQGTAHRDG